MGDLARASDTVSGDSALAQAILTRYDELLRVTSLPSCLVAAHPLTQAVDALEKEVCALQSQLEGERVRQQELT